VQGSVFSEMRSVPKTCVAGTWFKRVDLVDRRSALEELSPGLELETDEIEDAVVLSHGSKNGPGFWGTCEETDAVVVGRDECVLLAETNSKALPWHVVRYERTETGWRLRPRVDLTLPTEAQTDEARRAVVNVLSKYSSVASGLAPIIREFSDATETKHSRLSRTRKKGEGRLALALIRTRSDVAVAASARRRLDRLVVFAADASLEADARAAGLDHVYHNDLFRTYDADFFKLVALYFINSLGVDLLFVDPAVLDHAFLWDRALAHDADLVFLDDTPNHDPRLQPYHASTRLFFLRCTWRTQLFLDWLLFAADLTLATGFDPAFSQLLSEAESLLALTVHLPADRRAADGLGLPR